MNEKDNPTHFIYATNTNNTKEWKRRIGKENWFRTSALSDPRQNIHLIQIDNAESDAQICIHIFERIKLIFCYWIK